MSAVPACTVRLADRFARELRELAVRWQAADAPDPRLLVPNGPLAGDPGRALLLGEIATPDGQPPS